MAIAACHEINRFADGHGDAKIETDSPLIAGRAGNLLQAVGYIRLCTQIKFHVRIDRKAVMAFLADPAPLTVSLHKASVNAKVRLFADRTMDRGEALLNFFWGL